MTVPYEDAGDLPDGGLLPAPPSTPVTDERDPCGCLHRSDGMLLLCTTHDPLGPASHDRPSPDSAQSGES